MKSNGLPDSFLHSDHLRMYFAMVMKNSFPPENCHSKYINKMVAKVSFSQLPVRKMIVQLEMESFLLMIHFQLHCRLTRM